MEKKSYDFWVGLFVVLGLGALVLLALKAANLASFQTGSTYRLTANFDNIGALKSHAPVKSSGVTVGRIESIAFDTKDYQAKVIMNIDSNQTFPKDSSAKILTAGLLGEQYIGLDAGFSNDMFKSGDIIKDTSSAIVLEKLISQFLFSKAADTTAKPAIPVAEKP
jgi:phospholipid/cholesterol/gamma-HCH transport system substrate-binding protein